MYCFPGKKERQMCPKLLGMILMHVFHFYWTLCWSHKLIEGNKILKPLKHSSLLMVQLNFEWISMFIFFILENVGNDISYRILSEQSLCTDAIHIQYQQITHRQTNVIYIFKCHINVTGVRTENVLMSKYSSMPYLFF